MQVLYFPCKEPSLALRSQKSRITNCSNSGTVASYGFKLWPHYVLKRLIEYDNWKGLMKDLS